MPFYTDGKFTDVNANTVNVLDNYGRKAVEITESGIVINESTYISDSKPYITKSSNAPTINITKVDSSKKSMLFISVYDINNGENVNSLVICEGYLVVPADTDSTAIEGLMSYQSGIEWKSDYQVIVSPSYGRINVKSYRISENGE